MVNRQRSYGQKERPRYVYHERPPASVQERAERKGGGRSEDIFKQNVDVWWPQQGENRIRILPPTWEGHEHFAYKVYAHRYIGPDNGHYLCLAKHQQIKCPICTAAQEAKDNGDEDEFNALKAKEAYVVWIIDRDDKDSKPRAYSFNWMMDKDLAALAWDKRSGAVLLIDHPDEGHDVIIRKSGQGMTNTRYLPSITPVACPIHDDQNRQDEIMEAIQDFPIPDALKFQTAAYLARLIEGGESPAEEAADDRHAHEAEEARADARREPARREPARREAPQQEDRRPAPREAAPARRAPPPQDEQYHEPEPQRAPPARRPPPREAPQEQYADEQQEERAPPQRRLPERAPARAAPAPQDEEVLWEDEPQQEAPPPRRPPPQERVPLRSAPPPRDNGRGAPADEDYIQEEAPRRAPPQRRAPARTDEPF